ncbi:DUF1566 domain-containing protein [Legionella sp. km535]|uniref:InlB B-repeat-containing protein n=1 Tax=Legionella sp. km535 TaxID=2498107 RepID=UPI000F8F0AC8|nr:DUF1566 domain-containing protein [Legionella sp. km535]RUR20295.1 DUF1566 domain-containing protein [Legionella sp. km535]
MTKKQRHIFRNILLTLLFSCLLLPSVKASKPVWTFAPQSLTDITIAKGNSTQVIYTVRNHSSKPKYLLMKPVAGVSQVKPCELVAHGICTLTLNVNGSALLGDVIGGPILCQRGNSLMCYSPSQTDGLRIHLTEQPPVQQYTITPSANANGTISPAVPQAVNAGSSISFTASPNANFSVDQWFLDGNVVQNGGTVYQLSNIQGNHTIEVTFNQTTLSPLTSNLTLSINSPALDPPLPLTPRIIRIENTGNIPALNLQVNSTAFPAGSSITNNTCSGTLNAHATCDITITPGGTASANTTNIACNTSPGSTPVPTVVTVSADNASPTDINVLILGYGCIYQGGYLFSVDNTTSNLGSIGGKVAALTDEQWPDYHWSDSSVNTTADSLNDGFSNTNALAAPPGQYPAAQTCVNKNDQGFTDWFLPAICELGRYVGINTNAGCAVNLPNLYITLRLNSLGGFANVFYWSSSEYSGNPTLSAWMQSFIWGDQFFNAKNIGASVRCIRTFIP